MTNESDLSSAARRRFLNGLGLAATCTGAIAAAGTLGFSGAVSAKTDAAPAGGKADPAASGSSFPTKDYDWTKKRWAFGVDVNKCIGCLRCVEACKAENNVPRNAHQFRTWVERYVHIEGEEAARVDSQQDPVNIAASGSEKEYRFADRYKGAKVDKAFFVPKLCNHCSNPACVQVCPVGATYKTEDGVVLVDEKRCIGCRYCVQACPYGARYFDEKRGVPDKCTWCYHRITKGMQPACVDSCPTGARVFGNIHDRESPISLFVRNNHVQVLKQESGSSPNVYYVGLDKEVS
jgi:Fe-S-cluster-containing dehydrogenase component